MNRIEPLMRGFDNNPNYNMRFLLENLNSSTIVPQPNKYYTFIYKAKTRNIRYDQHPLILCGDVFKWGFTGFNVHWNQIRRYSWGEVLSNLYPLNEEEYQTLSDVPLARFRDT